MYIYMYLCVYVHRLLDEEPSKKASAWLGAPQRGDWLGIYSNPKSGKNELSNPCWAL